MAIKHFVNPSLGPRQMGLITTVETATRRIEAKLKDGGEVAVSLFDIPPFFVWPKVGDLWIIRKDGGYWKLDTKIDTDKEYSVDNLNAGEGKISADIIKTPSGKNVVVVDKTNGTNGQVVQYKDGAWILGEVVTNGGSSTDIQATATGSAAGTDPTVTKRVVGTTTYFDFTIPTGATGSQGSPGVVQSVTTASGSGITVGGTTANPTVSVDSTVTTLAGSQALTNKTYNGLTITSSTGTLTVTNGKTLTANNTLTFTGIDASSVAFDGGGTVAYTANKLSTFASTTSAELAGVISDETGSGSLVFGTSPTLTTSTIDAGATGVTTIKAGTQTAFTIQNFASNTVPLVNFGSTTQIVNATFNNAGATFNGSTSGSTTVIASANASGTLTLPSGGGTIGQPVIPVISKAGDYIANHGGPAYTGSGNLTSGVEYAMPIAFPQSFTIDTVGAYAASYTSTPTVRMAIRKDDGTGRPSTASGAIVGQGSFTLVSGGSTNYFTVTLSPNPAITASTLYWLILVVQGTANIRVAGSSAGTYYGYYLSAPRTSLSAASTNGNPGFVSGNAYATSGTLTDTGPTSWADMTLNTSTSNSFAGFVHRLT
jgi:hypothetical protein